MNTDLDSDFILQPREGFKLRPKKSLSQNFLVNGQAAREMVEALALNDNDVIMEIGAGQGALTRHLLGKANTVYAVEIDKRLCSYLEQRFRRANNLKIINQDVLKLNLGELIGSGSVCKVAGNLPYQITSPVLSFLLENKQLIALCVLMVQKEVALRICASPGNKDWSPLSITVQLHSDVKILFHLKPGSFFPPPQVDSSVIRIDFLPRPRVLIPNQKLFFKVVRSAFGQRRKMVANSLAANLDLPKGKVEVILGKAGIDPRRRAETLSLKEFAALSSAVEDTLN
jgi:16S rRNA (adenine1518-N6/adenine1519-N6)-dimethyltransferase